MPFEAGAIVRHQLSWLVPIIGLCFSVCTPVAGSELDDTTPAAKLDPVLVTNLGPVRGTSEGDSGGVHVFRGVRYAASTERRRFQRAADAVPWQEVVEATRFGNDCPQSGGGNVPVFASWANPQPKSEDCLFLNVWTRGLADDGKRPVMVWFHGGGYVAGSGSSHGYDGARLAERGDVVVITVNHRLNAFGYSYLGGLTDDPRYADSGNIGSLDMVKALEWVRDNAAAFGGDPENVTIFGESGGAAKVSTLMAMEEAQGLFHRVIAQSGSMSLAGLTPRIATPLAENLIETAGLQPGDVKGLASMPMTDLLKAMYASRSRGAFYRPVVDGRSLKRQPFTPDAPPVSAKVPLLVGTNRTEMRLQAGLADPSAFDLDWDELSGKIAPYIGKADPEEIIGGMRAAYPDANASEIYFQIATFRNYRGTAIRQAERKSSQPAPVYMYRMDWESPVEGGRLKAAHALEIGFVFDNVAKSVSYTGEGEAQQRMADLMADAWIAFARKGDPNTASLPNWPTYEPINRATMIFDVEPKVLNDPDPERDLLQRLLPDGRGN
ncbi:carboxylesterase/lipase family protein [Altererythrobacter sp.]|uniref:carboxylesterase/lipase family protein n=1 Tax=Altererythrobacter sp. TaxID=1872480 RepID=UPI003CFC1DB7